MVSKLCTVGVAAIFLVGCTQQNNPQAAAPSRPSDPAGVRLAANNDPPPAPAAVPPATAAAADPVNQGNPVNQLTIPSGTRVRIRLEETLDTKYCHPGEHFAAMLDEPLVVGNRVVVPRGAAVRGHVTEARRSGRFKGRAVLALALDSIQVNGASYAVATNMTARVSHSHKKSNLAVIGGTSGGGAAIGAIAGGGVGALIGAGAGAGAGTVAVFFTGRKNVVLPVETELTFSLRNPMTVRG